MEVNEPVNWQKQTAALNVTCLKAKTLYQNELLKVQTDFSQVEDFQPRTGHDFKAITSSMI